MKRQHISAPQAKNFEISVSHFETQARSVPVPKTGQSFYNFFSLRLRSVTDTVFRVKHERCPVGLVSRYIMKRNLLLSAAGAESAGVIAAPSKKDGAAQVLSKAEQADAEHREKIHKIGLQIVEATVKVAEKYVELAKYIRTNQIHPGVVRKELIEKLGFKKSRVSEIIRIADSPAEVWDEYEARRIGLKGALELTRGADNSAAIAAVSRASGAPAGEVEEHLVENGDGGTDARPSEEKSDADKQAAVLNSIAANGKKVLLGVRRAVELGVKSSRIHKLSKWDLGDGWVLRLEQQTKRSGFKANQPAGGESSAK